MIKVVIPDLVSNSYFPAVAAVELGFFKKEGLAAEVELIYPVDACYRALRDGRAHFVGGSAHSAPSAFPEWRGVKLLAALAQGMYWFLVLRVDIGAKRGDLNAVKGRRIGAAPLVDLGLKRLLAEAGIDLERDRVTITPVPGMAGSGISFGVNAAKALEEGKIDGFWANGMGAEVAVRRGVGTVILDVRRGDGPKSCFHYTCPALATTSELLARAPETAAAAVRAVVNAQRALKADVGLAAQVGARVFPAFEAELIADVVARDLPYYDATISPDFFRNMTRFATEVGLSSHEPAYADVVASEFRPLWQA
jgi:ABC-type nitrate/sulfonate/bicarbonate transport system substrate-binding protein